MNEESGRFRTAAIGGFHRQDVLDYIAEYTHSQQEKLRALQAQAEQLCREKEAAEGELSALRAEHQAAVTQRDDACRQAEESAARLNEQQEELASLRQETARLRALVDQLQPEAEAMQRLRPRLADIELEARGRSEQIVQRAEQEAAATRRALEQLLEGARQSFDVTRTDVEATASHMVGEMERLIGMLGRMTTAFDENERAIAALRVEEA